MQFRNAEQVVAHIDDIIVSLDGPPAIHDQIRRVPGAFSTLERGVRAVHDRKPDFPISARCTVQQANFRDLAETARAAFRLQLRSLSFLATDLTSAAFNRPLIWPADRQSQIALSEPDIELLEAEFESILTEWTGTGFIAEDRPKLGRIVRHFRAHLGLCKPEAPRCNAPWKSAVLEANGTVRPCFFHPAIGSAANQSLAEALNGPEAIRFRSNLDVSTNPVCQGCVCSLYQS